MDGFPNDGDDDDLDDDHDGDDHDNDDLGAESIGQPTSSAGPSSISTTWKPEKVKLVDFEFIWWLSWEVLLNGNGWSDNYGFSAWNCPETRGIVTAG